MPPFSKVEASKKHLLHETMQVALFLFFFFVKLQRSQWQKSGLKDISLRQTPHLLLFRCK